MKITKQIIGIIGYVAIALTILTSFSYSELPFILALFSSPLIFILPERSNLYGISLGLSTLIYSYLLNLSHDFTIIFGGMALCIISLL